MTTKYSPERVAELVALAGSALAMSKDAGIINRLSNALTAVSAERDILRGPNSDDRDELITAPIIRALQAAKVERDTAVRDLDAGFAASDHLSAKYYQRMRDAEREMHARELHHFEAEQSIREALELIQPSRLMVPTDMGYEATTRDVIQARAVLARALIENGESDD